MNNVQALHSFWSSFGLKAYDETSVPDDATLPYLTYEVAVDGFGNVNMLSASLWYRSTSWAEISEKEQFISDFIGRGGRMISYEGGSMWLQRGSPWAQRLGDPSDDMIRRIILNYTVEFLD